MGVQLAQGKWMPFVIFKNRHPVSKYEFQLAHRFEFGMELILNPETAYIWQHVILFNMKVCVY